MYKVGYQFFIYSVFNDTVSTHDYVDGNYSGQLIINWKRCGRKRSWPNSRYYPSRSAGNVQLFLRQAVFA